MYCWVSSMETAASDRLNEMQDAAPPGFYKCGCGRTTPNDDMHPSGPSPWSEPCCGICADEIIESLEVKHGQD